MHNWFKYKDFIFTTVTITTQEIRIVYQLSTKKAFFCFDDLMSAIGYKTDDNGSIQRGTSQRYVKKMKMQTFIELFPTAMFVPLEAIKNLSNVVSELSNNRNFSSNLNAIVSATLRSFITIIKDKKEVEIKDDLEDFIEIYRNQFSVATNNEKTVVKATDIIRYCGYKSLKVRDGFSDYSIKLKTKNGIAHFIPLDKFTQIASEMANEKYSKKMISLLNGFIKFMPIKNNKVIIDNDKSIVIFDSNVVPFIFEDNKIKFKTTDIQRICGYKKEGLMESFKIRSIKSDNCHYISLERLKELLSSKISQAYKTNINFILNKLYKFV
jgi:prophage antirepressor-like protein